MHVLTPEEMGEADRLAISSGPYDGYGLMKNAGRAIHREILQRYPAASRVAVLCGPGNNGGDGYVIAQLLAEDGLQVSIYAEGVPRPGGDAEKAARDCGMTAVPISGYDPADHDLIVDALYGAGLTKPLSPALINLAAKTKQAGVPVIAVDLPSGLSGLTGKAQGESFEATLTVTFFRKKPGHLLYPGRALCGELVVADIGIPERVLDTIQPLTFENAPALWNDALPVIAADTHKYRRGAAAVFSGGSASTGAARLAAMAAARSGTGAVTVLSPPSALLVNACHLTSVMVRPVGDFASVGAFLDEGKTAATLIGPGYGATGALRDMVSGLLSRNMDSSGRGLRSLVLDADALSVFGYFQNTLFSAIHASGLAVVMTPHDGEFARLFPDLANDDRLSKLEKARAAASKCGAIVVFKGADSVIAAPDGRAAINTNATSALATAGSGDVLAGICTGLLAQGMPGFEAACCAVWMHGEAGRAAGTRPVAEDFVEALRLVAFA